MIPRLIPNWARALTAKGYPGFLKKWTQYDGSPNTALTAIKGTLCFDYTNSDVYINTDGATAWTKIID